MTLVGHSISSREWISKRNYYDTTNDMICVCFQTFKMYHQFLLLALYGSLARKVNGEIQDTIIYTPKYSGLYYNVPLTFRPNVTVLFWSPAYKKPENWFWWFNTDIRKNTCPSLPCHYTTDRNKLNVSDAVLFNVYDTDVDLEVEDIKTQLPPYRFEHQRWVFFTVEPPTMRPVSKKIARLDGLFNWTMTYRRDSDIYAHFGKLLLTPNQTLPLDYDYSRNKTKQAAWFVSHCPTEGRREDYVRELQKYINVDIYGRCGPLKCAHSQADQCYHQLTLDYKFYLAFENIICRDYVTEKLLKVLTQDVVPVVFGGANYELYMPPSSYIDALKFKSPEDLAKYLIHLDHNSKEYNKYFDWKRGYTPKVLSSELYVCELCAQLLDSTIPRKTYEDLDDWWNTKSECREWKQPTSNDTRSK